MSKVQGFSLLTIFFILMEGCFHGVTYYYRPAQDTLKIQYTYQKTGFLDPNIKESSGLLQVQDSLLLTHGDSGNMPWLYLTNLEGKLLKKIYIKEIHNVDWEALSYNKPYIYIADIGNNTLQRQQFSIYRIPLDLTKDTLSPDKKIVYVYPDQQTYPKHRNHDAEAMLYIEPYCYVFTKNYGVKGTDVYRIDTQKDSVQAAVWIAHTYLDSYVTDVAYNAKKQEIAILTYGYVYLYQTKLDSSLFKQAKLTVRMRILPSQTEAITYLNNNALLITNEKGKIFTLLLSYKRRWRVFNDCCSGLGLL
jgi:hypothetical protein